MKAIQKIEKDTVIEAISERIKMVAPRNSWIVVNADGTFFNHPTMGYLINKTKKICQMYADAENRG